MKHLMELFVISLMLILASCGKEADTPSQPLETNEVKSRSARWKAQHRTADLLWLIENAIPTGSSLSHVKELLGSPLPSKSTADWYCYINADDMKESIFTIGLHYNQQSKVDLFEVFTKVRWFKLEQDASEYLLVPNLIQELHDEFVNKAPMLQKQPNTSPLNSWQKHYIQQMRPSYISKQQYVAVKVHIENSMSPAERVTNVLYGRISDLQQDGECWLIAYDHGMAGGYTAVIDVRKKKLVFLKYDPEG